MTQEQVEHVNVWVRECEVAWVECESGEDACRLEAELRAEFLPPLNRC